MTPPKQPTNQDLLKELRDIKSVQNLQAKDIEALKVWKMAEDAYRAALKQVRGEEADEKKEQQTAQLKSSAIKVLRDLSPILTALGILLYALLQGVGR